MDIKTVALAIRHVAEPPWICYNSSIAEVAALARSKLLILIVILIITLVSLIAVLWGGTVFFQGYIYTEPSPGVFWQAPAVAALLTFGYSIWCLSIALSSGASASNIPINTIFRFTPKEDMLVQPAPLLWAIKADPKKTGPDKDGEVVPYVSERVPDKLNSQKFRYFDIVDQHPWHGQGVIAIEIQPKTDDAAKIRFNVVVTEAGRFELVDSRRAQYRHFASDDGWDITEFEEGPTGLPVRFRWSRFLLNIFFNGAHLVAWFVGMWLLLRFQWGHALGLAVVMWLVMTLLMLPMMLGYAGEVSEARRTVTVSMLASASRVA